ncbi:hypothetical protein QWY31_10190 [Cytophagales bacterium LB-30]|uniref:DUF4382 domain-containing protein n=1 Tax=Shiella aurantiaca TaxID=3058365 RepID=A0ABT8F658_9BACT|nr:hypothetical protein [Shiella aurantiaca]MDN4165875.1 hypothetical protein [Shiella aurantiaca]
MKRIIYILIVTLSGCTSNEVPSKKNYATLKTLETRKVSELVTEINGRVIRDGLIPSDSVGFNIAAKNDSTEIIKEIRMPLDSIKSDGSFSYILTNDIGLEEEYSFVAIMEYSNLISRGIYQNLDLGPYSGVPFFEVISVSPRIVDCGDLITIQVKSSAIINEIEVILGNTTIAVVKNVSYTITFNVPDNLPKGPYSLYLKIGDQIYDPFDGYTGIYSRGC